MFVPSPEYNEHLSKFIAEQRDESPKALIRKLFNGQGHLKEMIDGMWVTTTIATDPEIIAKCSKARITKYMIRDYIINSGYAADATVDLYKEDGKTVSVTMVYKKPVEPMTEEEIEEEARYL